MVDGNISMEEDTELRDLVVQTLENNGVLSKVRAELRASVFLALEEQESVMNPEPLLNKSVKQYLKSSEGKLLFSLVREFLEYFGLDYTISVYDLETYFGKEYNYLGRNKLCEELGISSSEPLLGEILKNNINGAFNNSQKNNVSNNRLDKTGENTATFNNATFEVSVPKMLHNDSTENWNDADKSEKVETNSESFPQIPFNVTITDKKKPEQNAHNLINSPTCKSNEVFSPERKTVSRDASTYNELNSDENFELKTNETSNKMEVNETPLKVLVVDDSKRLRKVYSSNDTESSNNDISADDEERKIQTENTSKQKTLIVVENNVQNKKQIVPEKPFGKGVYFDEIIIDGKVEKVDALRHKTDSLLGELPPLISKSSSIFSDLPPLNCKRTNISDLKELMQIATDGADNYDEDFVSSASGSANEQSPSKEPDKLGSPTKSQVTRESIVYSEELIQSEEISEEIEEIEDIISNKSFIEDVKNKKVSKFTVGVTTD